MDHKQTAFQDWFEQANSVMNDWKSYIQKVNDQQFNSWQDVRKLQQQWINDYQSVLKNISSGSQFNPFNNQVAQDAFKNMMKSTEMYLQLFQLWQPFFRQLQNNAVDVQQFWKLTDPSVFKNFVDNLFQMDGTSTLQRFMEQYSQLTNLWMSAAMQRRKELC